MATREEISAKIRRDLANRGLTPDDPVFAFALESMEAFNRGVADLDDELADISARLDWLAHAATWVNRREPGEFEAFVVEKLNACDSSLRDVRDRWLRHLGEDKTNAANGRTQT